MWQVILVLSSPDSGPLPADRDEGCGLASFILLKPADIPAYVEYAARRDLASWQGHILRHRQHRTWYSRWTCGFGFCRLVVAEPASCGSGDDPAKWIVVRVATKYPPLLTVSTSPIADPGRDGEALTLPRWAPLVAGRADRDLVRPADAAGQRVV